MALVPEAEVAVAAQASLEHRAVSSGAEATTNTEGWAHIVGVAQGIHYLRVTGPEYAPTFSAELQLDPADDLLLDDITLMRPATLRVTWQGELEPALGATVSVDAATQVATCGWQLARWGVSQTDAKAVLLEDLPPGPWLISLLVGVDDSSEIARQPVHLAPGETRDLVFDLSGNTFHGTVEDTGGPIEGTLRFVRLDADAEPPELRASTDQQGNFSLVSAPGAYRVEVTRHRVSPESSDKRATVARVVLDDPEEPVTIQLPSSAIRGWVEDDDGTPLADVWVRAHENNDRAAGVRRVGWPQAVKSGTDGTFSFEDLAAATWTLRAYRENLRSRPMSLHLADEETRDGVTLVLAEGPRLRGRVTTAGIPITSALGAASMTDINGAELGGGVFHTDDSGHFETIFAPRSEGVANLWLQAPGKPITTWALRVPDDTVLEVPPVGGRLTLKGRFAQHPTILHNG